MKEDPINILNPGSTNPVEDFLADLATGSKLVLQRSFHNMTLIIINLVVEGGTGAHYRKSISCLKVLSFTYHEY